MSLSPARDERDRVGPYQLVKAIGAGGSARIDLARIDRAYGFQRHVVIKRPLEHLRADPKAAASLRREARIGARLRHPNLVAVLDAGVHDGYDYLVLEYVNGGSLRTLMQDDTPSRVRAMPIAVALALVNDVARALHAAHELADETGAPLGLVHRDVSPGNILVGLDGAVKLADFGIAKETRVQTLSGSMHGTVTYMAPEQCRGHAFDRRADIFSLGVVLYELVTGARLFWADNDVASLHRVLSGNVARPRKVRPQLAPALEDIIMTAIAHDQAQRFATARDLSDALELHAQEAGEILGARMIARWTHDILGPRDNPWLDAPTVVEDIAPEGSLVEIIEANAVEDPPPDPTFGPSRPSLPDEIDTSPRRDPVTRPARARSRKAIAAIVAFGLAASAGVTALVMMRAPSSPPPPPTTTNEVVPPPPSEPPPPAPPPVEEAPTNVAEPNKEPADEAVVNAIEIQPTERSTSTSRRRRPKSTPPPTVTPDAGITAEPEPPKPSAGSQSRPTKVEWKPELLLPTDPASGTNKSSAGSQK